MRRLRAALIVTLLATVTTAAESQQSPQWLVRARGLWIHPFESGSAGGFLTLDPGWAIEADVTRRLTSLLALEFSVTTSGHNVRSQDVSNGSMHTFLPALLVQLHPLARPRFDPYIGAGANAAFFYRLTGDAGRVFDLTHSVGWALQAGVDVALGRGVVLNLDLKYLSMATDMRSPPGLPIKLDMDPIVLGAGAGFRF